MSNESNELDNDFMLTTFDNPFNPFTQFEAWFKYDSIILGYNSCLLLANYSNVSDIVSDEIQEQEIDEAMNEIVRKFPTIYKKVLRSDYETVDSDLDSDLDRVGGSA